jgi:hypothetical protein
VFLGQCREGRVESSRLFEIITEGTNENTAVASPSKKDQRLTRCDPAEGVSTTARRGRPNSNFLSAYQRLRREAAVWACAKGRKPPRFWTCLESLDYRVPEDQ